MKQDYVVKYFYLAEGHADVMYYKVSAESATEARRIVARELCQIPSEYNFFLSCLSVED